MFVWNEGDLNPEQEAAVAEERSVFLVACPGSGKTRTLTYKIASELSNLESDKQWVVAITYTHRAADEIHERVENLGVDTSMLWIGTIHSFCLEWVLKPYAIYHDALKHRFRVINSHDTERLVTELCRPYRNPTISDWDCGYYYTSAGRTLTCHVNKQPYVRRILDQYRANLLENRQIDFELVLCFAYELIVQQPSISMLLGSLFSCVLVDEYQDTKEIQYAILASILKAGQGKVRTFIVGDPNQAILRLTGRLRDHRRRSSRRWPGSTSRRWSCRATTEAPIGSSRYFANYNVHATKISSDAKHKEFPSLISFDTVTTRDDLEAELVRLIRYNIETCRHSAARGVRPGAPMGAPGQHDPQAGRALCRSTALTVLGWSRSRATSTISGTSCRRSF